MSAAVVALVTAPSDRAEILAETLVVERLAACVNVLPGARSVYRWEGLVRREDESLLVIKTTGELVEALRARLAALHPYAVFELLTLDVTGGNPAYLAWLKDSVG